MNSGLAYKMRQELLEAAQFHNLQLKQAVDKLRAIFPLRDLQCRANDVFLTTSNIELSLRALEPYCGPYSSPNSPAAPTPPPAPIAAPVAPVVGPGAHAPATVQPLTAPTPPDLATAIVLLGEAISFHADAITAAAGRFE